LFNENNDLRHPYKEVHDLPTELSKIYVRYARLLRRPPHRTATHAPLTRGSTPALRAQGRERVIDNRRTGFFQPLFRWPIYFF